MNLTQRKTDALAWMKAQAKTIKPNLPDDASVYQMAGVISSKISLKKRRVTHRKICTCSVVDMGYTSVVQMTLDKDCPFHKHYIADQNRKQKYKDLQDNPEEALKLIKGEV